MRDDIKKEAFFLARDEEGWERNRKVMGEIEKGYGESNKKAERCGLKNRRKSCLRREGLQRSKNR